MYKMIQEGACITDNIVFFKLELTSALEVVGEYANKIAYNEDNTEVDFSIEYLKQTRTKLIDVLYNINNCLKFIRIGSDTALEELEEHSID